MITAFWMIDNTPVSTHVLLFDGDHAQEANDTYYEPVNWPTLPEAASGYPLYYFALDADLLASINVLDDETVRRFI